MKYLIYLFLAITFTISAQNKDPHQIIKNVTDEYGKIEDYKVDAVIKVDVNFMKVPELKAVIYYKKPDKMTFKAEGFALLPKTGLNFSPSQFTDGEYDAIYSGEEKENGKTYDIIKIIPKSDTSETILTQLTIDNNKRVITEAETTTRNSGSYKIKINYKNVDGFTLPSEMIMSLNAGKGETMQAPSAQFDAPEKNKKGNKRDKMKNINGTVTVIYSGYEVNKGLDDKIFEDKKETPSE